VRALARTTTAEHGLMFDHSDGQLEEWARGVLGGEVAIALEPPGPAAPQHVVSLYLLELAPEPPARNTTRAPLQIAARYLVTTYAPAPGEAHRLLGELAFAALEQPGFEVDLASLPTELWAAFGVPPRPAFVVRVMVRRPRPEPAVPRVRMPLIMQAQPMAGLEGVVLGPEDIPLAGARVELPGLDRVTHTDARGRFYLPGVPRAGGSQRLRVSAKGSLQELIVEPAQPAPLVIRFDFG
jgi:hypothetical protein